VIGLSDGVRNQTLGTLVRISEIANRTRGTEAFADHASKNAHFAEISTTPNPGRGIRHANRLLTNAKRRFTLVIPRVHVNLTFPNKEIAGKTKPRVRRRLEARRTARFICP
jgi:hypothetical protein